MGERGPTYTVEQEAELRRVEADLGDRLAAKPRRLAHSLSVARCAEGLALRYGVDPYLARLAGTLHDWDKALPREELLSRARDLGIDMGVSLDLVEPLLHGMVTARLLPARYPEIPDEVWRAIAVHTTASTEMSPLDQVIFVADTIEPLRPASPGIVALRELSLTGSLDELFWEAFVGGVVYVLSGSRYLWPGTIDIYNTLARRRSSRKA